MTLNTGFGTFLLYYKAFCLGLASFFSILSLGLGTLGLSLLMLLTCSENSYINHKLLAFYRFFSFSTPTIRLQYWHPILPALPNLFTPSFFLEIYLGGVDLLFCSKQLGAASLFLSPIFTISKPP
jgi:hypothetical protein